MTLVQPKPEQPKPEEPQPKPEEVPSPSLPGLTFGAPLGGAFAQRIALEVKDEIATPKPEETPRVMELDSYQAAAVEALRSRNQKRDTTKKEEQRLKREADKKAKQEEKLRAQAAKLEEAANQKSAAAKAKAAKAEVAKAEPKEPNPKRRRLTKKTTPAKGGKKKAVKAEVSKAEPKEPKQPKPKRPEPVELSRKEALRMVPCPNTDGSDPAPLDYNGGRIYVSGRKQAYRTIRTRGDYYTERAFSWKRLSAPTRALWKSALAAIDAQRASE